MKRVKIIGLIVILSMSFVGCNGNVSKKSLGKARKSIAAEEYDKAIMTLELAIEEGKPSKKVVSLHEILVEYMKAKKFGEEGKYKEGIETLEEIEKSYKNIEIKENIIKLKAELNEGLENGNKEKEILDAANKKIGEKKYSEAKGLLEGYLLGGDADGKKNIEELIKKCNEGIGKEAKEQADKEKKEKEDKKKKEEEKNSVKSLHSTYINKLNKIEKDVKELEMYAGNTVEMKQGASIAYKKWDDALNEIYGVLKNRLQKAEFETLKKKQIEWIKFKEKAAIEEGKKFEGGTLQHFAEVQVEANHTKDRCYYLVNNYIK